VCQRETPALLRLASIHDDPGLDRKKEPRAVELFDCLDMEPEQVLDNRLDGDRQRRHLVQPVAALAQGVGL